jgi:uncharacterized protein with FMN-binding domain
MAPTNKNKKVANSLVALSSAAVLSVYAAGYVRTRAAADRFSLLDTERRPESGSVRRQPDLPAAPPPSASPSTTAIPAPLARPVQAAPSGSPSTSAGSAASPAATDVPSAAATTAPSDAPAPPPAESAAPTIDEQKIADTAIASTAPPKSQYKDGTYLGWGHCRHGDIQARVVIEDGRIASATIATCLTRYSCSVIDKLPPEVAQRQSPDVDTISGATQSGDAFYYAVLDALYLAK